MGKGLGRGKEKVARRVQGGIRVRVEKWQGEMLEGLWVGKGGRVGKGQEWEKV